MKLVIISNMAHYRTAGGLVGHGATVRELDALATLFDEVRHVGCLHDEPAPASARPYQATNLEVVPLPPAGGADLRSKLDIVRQLPHYTKVIVRELRDADAVHVRCPANVTLCALAVLAVTRGPPRRWVKYAGAWRPAGPEPLSYRLQRRWLASSTLRTEVTVNGEWVDQPAHVHAFINPCLTDDELARGRIAAASKPNDQLRLLFVGHLGLAKNPGVAIETLVCLRARGLQARLDLAGEGSELPRLRDEVERRGLAEVIVLHGPLPRERLDELYAAAHFVVLPSRTEGWPKVLAEGMAHGALPIATAVGSVPEILMRVGAGVALPLPATPTRFADEIVAYLDDPTRWARERSAAVDGARRFGYAAYLASVRALLRL